MENSSKSNNIGNLSGVDNYKNLVENWNYSKVRCDSSDPEHSTQDKSMNLGQKSSFTGKQSTSANSSFNVILP